MEAATLIVMLHLATGWQIFSWTFGSEAECRTTLVIAPADAVVECVVPEEQRT